MARGSVICHSMACGPQSSHACFVPSNLCTNQERRHELMTFGAPADVLPSDDDGTVLPCNHVARIEQRIELERMERNNQISHVSGPFDVLLVGRGKAVAKRLGNVRRKF
jgi:hypothetical protein